MCHCCKAHCTGYSVHHTDLGCCLYCSSTVVLYCLQCCNVLLTAVFVPHVLLCRCRPTCCPCAVSWALVCLATAHWAEGC